MIKIGDKVYRNLQEQVAKNKDDIDWLKHQPAVDGYTTEEADEKFQTKEEGLTKEEASETYAAKTSVKPIYMHIINLEIDLDIATENQPHINFVFFDNEGENYSGNSLNALAEKLYDILLNVDPYDIEQSYMTALPCNGYIWNGSPEVAIWLYSLKPYKAPTYYGITFYSMDEDSYDHNDPSSIQDDYLLRDLVIKLQ